MPRLKPEKDVSFLKTGKYIGTISEVKFNNEKQSLKVVVETSWGVISENIKIDADGSPLEGWPYTVKTQRLLRACGIPSVEYWVTAEEDRDADFGYDWNDLLAHEIYFEVVWSNVSSKYPKSYANLTQIYAAKNAPEGVKLGPDGCPKPVFEPEIQDVPF